MSNLAITATLTFSDAGGAQRLLQVVIADALNTSTDTAIRDVHELAEECHCTPRYVRRLILAQIAAGELVGLMNDRGGGAWCNFAIPIYPGEEGYDPQPCEGADHVCCGTHTPLYISREKLYREKGRAERKRRTPPRQKRLQAVIPGVDNSATYAQAGNDSSYAGGNNSSESGNNSSESGNGETHAGNNSSHAYKSTQSDPVFTQVDPGVSPAPKKISRRELEHAAFQRELAEHKAWRERKASQA